MNRKNRPPFLNHPLHKNPNRNWFGLDTAGTLFPATLSKNQTSLFRLSCTFRKEVKRNILQRALINILPRFPYFHVELKPGLFWYYFDPSHIPPQVVDDSRFPCMHFQIKKRGQLPFRVRLFKNRIAVEFSHAITDGFGALTFLKSLAAEYLTLCGVRTKDWGDIIRKETSPDPEEEEDAFLRHSPEKIPWPPVTSSAHHLGGRRARKGEYFITTGIIPISSLKEKTKETGFTINEYLISQLLFCIQELASQGKRSPFPPSKPIRIMVPVNLRALFPSKTMKNFILYVMPDIDPALGHYTAEEIQKKTHYHMRSEVNRKLLSQHIFRSVNGSRHYLFRIMPLFLKNFLLTLISRFYGERTYTTSLSNLGMVQMPPKFAKEILRFDFYPPPNDITSINASVISNKDNLHISFGSLLKERTLEHAFFSTLVKAGVKVRIESNDTGG